MDYLYNDFKLKMMKKVPMILLSILILLVFLLFIGPKPNFSEPDYKFKNLPIPIEQLEAFILKKQKNQNIKAGNESKIEWANSKKKAKNTLCHCLFTWIFS